MRFMIMDKALLNILACSLCHGPLKYQKPSNELLCTACRLAYPIEDGIPVMLKESARLLDENELEALKTLGS